MKRDPLVEVELGIRGDTAAALGRAGHKLAATLGALRAHDSSRSAHDPARDPLVQAAADALWGYVVQREAIGLTDHAPVARLYGISAELWKRMGVIRTR
jgi:hypothetical protein